MPTQIANKAADLDIVALDYRVRLTPEQAAEFCLRRDPLVGELLAEIDKVIPPMQYEGDNPNNGFPHHNYYIGREATRVIYVEVIRAYMDTDEQVAEIAEQIKQLAKKYEADEINDEGERGAIFLRIWWD